MSVVAKASSGFKAAWTVIVFLVIVAAVAAVMKVLDLTPSEVAVTLKGWVLDGLEVVKEVWRAIA